MVESYLSKLTAWDYIVLVLGVVILLLGWYNKKSWLRVVLYRFVVSAENNIVGNKVGYQRLIQVKNKFRNWIYSKSFFAGFICEFLITDKDIEKAVNWVLKTAKEELFEIEASKESIAKFAVEEVRKELIESPAIQNQEVDIIMDNINKKVSDKNGYVQAFARYNEEDKFNAGVEVGMRF